MTRRELGDSYRLAESALIRLDAAPREDRWTLARQLHRYLGETSPIAAREFAKVAYAISGAAAAFNAQRAASTATVAGSGVQTFTFSPASNCVQGNTCYFSLGCINSASSSVSSASDNTTGNTWTRDQTSGAVAQSFATFSSYQAVAMTTSTVITVTVVGGTTNIIWAYWLEEFVGNYSGRDTQVQSAASNSASLPTSTSAATTAADEVSIAMYSTSSTSGTITKNANYTAFTTGQQRGQMMVYRLLTATGTQNADGTDSAMVSSTNGLVNYKAVVAAGSRPPMSSRRKRRNHLLRR